MKERPILFSAAMIRAILDGRKSQTRRIVKPQPVEHEFLPGDVRFSFVSPQTQPGYHAVGCHVIDKNNTGYIKLPFGKPGDRLWVRETWRGLRRFESMPPSQIERGSLIAFEADPNAGDRLPTPNGRMGKIRPGIFMPRWASRITLEVTDIRVERVQDITEGDAKAEGVRFHEASKTYGDGLCFPTAKEAFRALWEKINGAESWAANPWVWVIGFKPADPEAAHA